MKYKALHILGSQAWLRSFELQLAEVELNINKAKNINVATFLPLHRKDESQPFRDHRPVERPQFIS